MVVTYALGQSVQWCSPEGICIALTIPGIQSGADGPDLYATLKAPAEYKWFAVGFGEQMEGTLMLVNWPWNNKVVVSPRLATYSSLPSPLLDIVVKGVGADFQGSFAAASVFGTRGDRFEQQRHIDRDYR